MYKGIAIPEYRAFRAAAKFNKLRGINEGAECSSPASTCRRAKSAMAGARRSTESKGKVHPSLSNPCHDLQIPVRQAKAGFLYYAYILRSENFPDLTYVGSTSDLRRRLAEHNAGKSMHTSKFKPRNLIAYLALPERHLAEELERGLKRGSGCAFTKRHLLTDNERKP
jgi:putative endonuclease